MPACLGGGREGAWLSLWKGCGQGQHSCDVRLPTCLSALPYSCFLAAVECGLGDRGCVAVAGKVERRMI